MDAIDSETAPSGTGNGRSGSGRSGMPQVLSFAISAAAVLGISLAIAWPLWSLASSSRVGYSLAFVSALGAIVALLIASRARRRLREARRRAGQQ